MDPHEAALVDLIDLARRRGGLTMEDLRKALPIDSMSLEDISHVLTRLDQAGFDLEVDPDLLSPQHTTAPQDAAPFTRREQTELPQPFPGSSHRGTGLPATASKPIPINHATRRADYIASAPMLPWIIAFVIVVFVVFAVFAF